MEKRDKQTFLMLTVPLIVFTAAVRLSLLLAPFVLFIIFDWKCLLLTIPAIIIDFFFSSIVRAVMKTIKEHTIKQA